jgi:hypothetical protein
MKRQNRDVEVYVPMAALEKPVLAKFDTFLRHPGPGVSYNCCASSTDP